MTTDIQTAARALMEAAGRQRLERLRDIAQRRMLCRAKIQEANESRERLARLDAEYARVEAQTAADIAREAMQAAQGAVILYPQPPGEVIEAPLTQPQPDSNKRYRPHGAPWSRVEAMADEAERAAEHVTVATFDPSRHEGGPDGVLCLHFAGIPAEFFAHHATWETPSGKQMGSADVLALSAREWRPVGTTWAEVKARVMQPTVKPAEDEDPIEKAFWRYCMLIDKTQKTARVKAGYLEAPYPNRDAFKIAVRSTVLGLGVPAASFTPPAPTLLDLTKLPPGTVCEATGQIARGSHVILPGERFAFAGSSTEFLARVRVIERDESFDVPLMVHARVVEVPR